MPGCGLRREQVPITRGLCPTHYRWELYHRRRDHNAGYFADYAERHDELAARGRAVLARARRRAA